jgi:ketosteroid isomerase-like protein
VTPTEHVRRMFATFDAKDVSGLAAFMTDDVRLRLGNSEAVQGKAAFVEAVNAFLASVAGFRHQVLNVWSDGDALIAEFDVHYTRLSGGEGHSSLLQRVPAPGRFGCGVPQLHRRQPGVRLMRSLATEPSMGAQISRTATIGDGHH